MRLEHTFVLPADVDTAWTRLLDIEQVAPCMPGATLDTVDGDSFTGQVKVKLGPIGLTYKGSARFLERNDADHRAVVSASGRETRGPGTAEATVTASLETAGADLTRVRVITDLNITGRPAQFGRGVLSDVGDRLIGQFAARLADMMGQPTAPSLSPPREPSLPEPATVAHVTNSSASPPPAVRVAETEPASMNLLALVGPPLLKRIAPVAIGAVIGALLVLAIVALR
jgi:carbon monoxide dehydrogenase subunit G